MSEAPRSNRPTPRTTAAVEAELRRQIRADLAQARQDADDGDIDDESLASIIAHAIGVAIGWHLESPEHVRPPFQDRPSFQDRRASQDRPPRDFGGPRGGGRPPNRGGGGGGGFGPRRPPPRGR